MNMNELQELISVRNPVGVHGHKDSAEGCSGLMKMTSGTNKFYKSSAVAEMGDRLATIGMVRKWGGAAVGGWVSI